MKRLTPASVTLLMFGIVGCLVVAYVAKGLFAVEDKAPEIAMRNVPMAVVDIQPGTMITEEHLGQGPFPGDRLERDMLLVNRVIVGRVAKTAIPAATPIRAGQLYQPGEMPLLQLAPGMRAVSVEVGDSVQMVDGLIRPGQYVDVHFTVSATNDNSNMQGGMTLRLFSGVRVLSINRSLAQSRVERGSNRVTLELTQEQANMLILAGERGRLTLTYNPDGKGTDGVAVSSDERATLNEILGLKAPFQSEIYRGSGRNVLSWRGRQLIGSDGETGRSMPNRPTPAAEPTGNSQVPTSTAEPLAKSASLRMQPR